MGNEIPSVCLFVATFSPILQREQDVPFWNTTDSLSVLQMKERLAQKNLSLHKVAESANDLREKFSLEISISTLFSAEDIC